MSGSITGHFKGARFEMGTFRPRLLEAETTGSRMDALCAFIEFWLGPRQPSYGESAQALSECPLPMPLRRLYDFAGRWPHRAYQREIVYEIPAFSHQDCLATFHRLSRDEGGKLVFLQENQRVWNCRTLPDGDDPPVSCHGDLIDLRGGYYSGEKLVCESLSRFLATFVLREITFGSRLCLVDEGLSARFASERDAAVPIWIDGPYVHGAVQNHYLWRGMLVADLWGNGKPRLAANHEEGIEFLTQNQGPVNRINLIMYRPWTLDIRSDGSARIRYLRSRSSESAEAPAGTFDFPDLLATLSAAVSVEGHHKRNAMVGLGRKGQSLRGYAGHQPDGGLATSLFRRTLERATEPNEALERRFATE
jgi:hypothetical protein